MSEAEDRRLFKIGQIARKAGVSRRTLRYYEELGLLHPCQSPASGFRLYSPEDLHRLRVISTFKEMGFSLREIKSVFSPEPADSRDDRLHYSKKILQKQRGEIQQRIDQLENRREQIEKALQVLAGCEQCSAEGCPPGCSNRKAFLCSGRPDGESRGEGR